eukprot:g79384.t1
MTLASAWTVCATVFQSKHFICQPPLKLKRKHASRRTSITFNARATDSATDSKRLCNDAQHFWYPTHGSRNITTKFGQGAKKFSYAVAGPAHPRKTLQIFCFFPHNIPILSRVAAMPLTVDRRLNLTDQNVASVRGDCLCHLFFRQVPAGTRDFSNQLIAARPAGRARTTGRSRRYGAAET